MKIVNNCRNNVSSSNSNLVLRYQIFTTLIWTPNSVQFYRILHDETLSTRACVHCNKKDLLFTNLWSSNARRLNLINIIFRMALLRLNQRLKLSERFSKYECKRATFQTRFRLLKKIWLYKIEDKDYLNRPNVKLIVDVIRDISLFSFSTRSTLIERRTKRPRYPGWVSNFYSLYE